jgi:hypothetical protein
MAAGLVDRLFQRIRSRQPADRLRIEKCRLTDDAGQNIVF